MSLKNTLSAMIVKTAVASHTSFWWYSHENIFFTLCCCLSHPIHVICLMWIAVEKTKGLWQSSCSRSLWDQCWTCQQSSYTSVFYKNVTALSERLILASAKTHEMWVMLLCLCAVFTLSSTAVRASSLPFTLPNTFDYWGDVMQLLVTDWLKAKAVSKFRLRL